MEKISYKILDFEGPLDLLLHLITKNKLNIYDIEISLLLDQYLEHIDTMRANDMDVASEFLEMAARLVYIKTVSLLPKHEETEKLKEELTGELIEYQECKEIAEILSKNISFDSFSREPAEIDFDMSYRIKHNVEEICKAYLYAAGKNAEKIPVKKEEFSEIVSKRIVSVSSKIVYLLDKIRKVKELGYNDIFGEAQDRSELVAIFLALLELVKDKKLCTSGNRDDLKVKIMSGETSNEG